LGTGSESQSEKIGSAQIKFKSRDKGSISEWTEGFKDLPQKQQTTTHKEGKGRIGERGISEGSTGRNVVGQHFVTAMSANGPEIARFGVNVKKKTKIQGREGGRGETGGGGLGSIVK